VILRLLLDYANVDAVTAAALLTGPREDFFDAYEISSAFNRVANDRPVRADRPITHHAGDRGKLG